MKRRPGGGDGRGLPGYNHQAGTLKGHPAMRLRAAPAARAEIWPELVQDPAVPVRAGADAIAPISDHERRYLTILLSDMVGSTDLSAELDPEELAETIKAHYARWESIIVRYGGFLARFTGDGVLAYFGYPVAHEDAAERAACAALEIVGATGQQTDRAGMPSRPIRVGLATGLVIVGGRMSSNEEPAFGMAPNLAERLQAIAPSNCVIISEPTRHLLGSKFDCEEFSCPPLPGLSVPVRAWRLLRPRSVSRFAARRSDYQAPIVGRHAEMEILQRCWSDAGAGHGRVVQVSGEPGIGKSCLVESFLSSLERIGHPVLRCQCSPYRANTAFHPLIEEIERSAGLTHGDGAPVRFSKMEALIGPQIGHDEQLLPLFAVLLSLPAKERYPNFAVNVSEVRARVIEGLVQRLLLLARRSPLGLLIEDIQWSDPSTQDFLTALVKAIKSARILLLVTTRSDFAPLRAARPETDRIVLGRLTRREALGFVKVMTGDRAVPDEIVAEIVERADGVPLYLEEFTRWAFESDVSATREQPARNSAARRSAIPTTLRESLMSQLDRFAAAKPVAQLGAAIGRSFPYWLLARLHDVLRRRRQPEQRVDRPKSRRRDSKALRAALTQLVSVGLLVRQQHPSEEVYAFRHELIREAAYECLPNAKRQELHREIARIIAEERKESSEMRPELIAYHYMAAGLEGEAAPLWLEAGERALREAANREARANLEFGLQCLRRLPESADRARRELRMQARLGQALIAISGHASPEVHRAFARAHELCLAVSDAPELFTVAWGITAHHLVKGDIRLHLDLSARLLEIAERGGDPGELIVAHTSRTLSLYFGGRFVAAHAHLQEVLKRYDRAKHRHLAFLYAVDRKMITCQFGTWILWKMGFPDRARELEQELNRHAHGLDHPNSLVQALTAGASVYMLCREPDRLLERVTQGVAIAEAHGNPVWIDHADFWLGWALAEKGETDDGIVLMRRALAAYQANGAGSSIPKFLGLLADRLGEVGQYQERRGRLERAREHYQEGLGLLERALEHIERTGETASEAETHRLRGKLLYASGGDVAAAEDCLRQALAVARGQEAKGWELRAATTLAQLLHETGRRGEARDVLEPVHAWFTEGFDTPDLKEAEQLLGRLA